MDKIIEHVCLIVAMREEAAPIIQQLSLEEKPYAWSNALPLRVYEGKLSNTRISCVVNGLDPEHNVDLIGPVPATLSANLACANLCPDVVISCGTAGLLSDDAGAIGDIYLSDSPCIFHDRRVPLAGFDSSATGHFETLNVKGLAQALNAKTGKLSSGSSFARDERELETMAAHQAVIKEMEGAAIAWVASLYKVPFFAIKAITNALYKEDSSEDQFEKNLGKAVESLSGAVVDALSYMDGKTLNQLG